MLDFKIAQQMLASFARSFGQEHIALEDALGRIIAEDIFSDRDYPPFNRATMDGFALRWDDLNEGRSIFDVVEVIFAGQEPQHTISAGRCYKIMTGAAVPPTADIVIKKEDTVLNGNQVTITFAGQARFSNIARMGEDTKNGELVKKAPMICTPPVISVLAAFGKLSVLAERLPKISIFTTGNEIRQPGEQVTPFQIRNSNRYLLESMLKIRNIVPAQVAHLADEPVSMAEAFLKALNNDIIIVSGAVSAGDADFVPGVMETIGVEKIFHRLSIKPGKPMWAGRHPNGCMVFALPGNPFSSLVTFLIMVDHFIGRCLGVPQRRKMAVTIGENRSKKSSLDEFFPVRIQPEPLTAMPVHFNSSGDILAAMFADGIAHHPALLPELQTGDNVDMWLLA